MRVLLFILILVFTVSAQDHFSNAAFSARPGTYETALNDYRSALKTDRSQEASARTHHNAGVCLYQLGRHAEAIIEFREAIALKGGKYQRAWYSLGMAEAAAGNNPKAKEAFTKALELNKNDAEAWFDLGMVLINDKDYPAARAAFEKAVDLRTVSIADAHNNIGVILALGGDVAAAIKKFELSGSPEAIRNIEYCRGRAGDLSSISYHLSSIPK